MFPDTLYRELEELLERYFLAYCEKNGVLILSEEETFHLWNLLGEELGIDLSLLTNLQRAQLLDKFKSGSPVYPKEMGSLLWLLFYSDYQEVAMCA